MSFRGKKDPVSGSTGWVKGDWGGGRKWVCNKPHGWERDQNDQIFGVGTKGEHHGKHPDSEIAYVTPQTGGKEEKLRGPTRGQKCIKKKTVGACRGKRA